MAKYLDVLTGFAEQAHWILPALGLLFIFLCIVSKGFRNFIIGLIILSVLFFEGAWFYSHFYRTDEERAEFRAKVIEVFRQEKQEGKAQVGRVEIIEEREVKRERADIVEREKEVEKQKEPEKKFEPGKKKDPPTPIPARTPVPTRTPIRFLLKDRKR